MSITPNARAALLEICDENDIAAVVRALATIVRKQFRVGEQHAAAKHLFEAADSLPERIAQDTDLPPF